MATNHVQPGEVVGLSKDSISSGDIIVENSLKGVALIDTNDDGDVQVATEGVFTLTTKGNDGSADSAVSVGNKLYYDSTEDRLDLNDSGTFFGIALESVDSGAESDINVLIVQG